MRLYRIARCGGSIDQGERSDAPFTFCDLFAGIGGIRMPFEELGGRCVFSCEWDKFAQKTYRMNYGETPGGRHPSGRIKRYTGLRCPARRLSLSAILPCRRFEEAIFGGDPPALRIKRREPSFSRSLASYATSARKAFLLENVKNLTSHDGGKTFKVIRRQTLEEDLGYHIFWKVLDSKTGRASTGAHLHRGVQEEVPFSWDDLEVPDRDIR